MSRCRDFSEDFPLQCHICDIASARQVSGVVSVANERKISPDEEASDLQQFSSSRHSEVRKLEDICRQHAGLDPREFDAVKSGMPNLFLTVSAAEWRFPLPEIHFEPGAKPEELEKNHATMTMHILHCLTSIVKTILQDSAVARAVGIARVDDWCIRIEFQKKGTPHIHCISCVEYADPLVDRVSGRSGTEKSSDLVVLLESTFGSSVDVQAGASKAALLNYVVGCLTRGLGLYELC